MWRGPAGGGGSGEAGTLLSHTGVALPFVGRGFSGELCAGPGLPWP